MGRNQIFVLALANVPTMIALVVAMLQNNGRLDDLGARMSSFDSRLSSMDGRLATMENRITALDYKFSRLTSIDSQRH